MGAADRFVRESVSTFNARQYGHFILSGGEHSPEKIDLETIWSHEPIRRVIGEFLTYLPQVPVTDVIVGVPHGGKLWSELVHEISGIPQVRLCKLPEHGRGVFDFMTEADQELAMEAKSATIIEDVVSRAGSAVAVRDMLPNGCEIDLRAIWNRGELVPENFSNFRSAHFLVQETLLSYPEEACPEHGGYKR